jgi:hypothetical protein
MTGGINMVKTGFSQQCFVEVKGATINGVTYELAEFIYLGTLISNDNSVVKEIQRRILAGNRTYFAARSLFRRQLLSRATKIILYKTLISPVVSYGAEAWTLTKKEQALLIFERKIFRRTYEVCSNSIQIGIVVVVHWVGCICNQS